jgi:hypothetical protein
VVTGRLATGAFAAWLDSGSMYAVEFHRWRGFDWRSAQLPHGKESTVVVWFVTFHLEPQ